MKKIFALLMACLLVFGLAACGDSAEESTTAATSPMDVTYDFDVPTEDTQVRDIDLTVWAPQSELGENNNGWLVKQCEAFAAANPLWNIHWTFQAYTEEEAVAKVIEDPNSAADLFFFNSAQLPALLNAKVITRQSGATLVQMEVDTVDGVVNTVSQGEAVYGVPYTTDSYVMYYDSSVFTQEDVKSLDAMLLKGKVAVPVTNGDFLASFYLANGCSFDAERGINFSGEKGVAVTNYLAGLVKNQNFVNDVDAAGKEGLKAGTVKAFFSTAANAVAAKEALGEHYAVATLPAITLGEVTKQLVPFSTTKAMGVNPKSSYPSVASALAAFLTTADAQLAHYEANGTVPVAKELLTGNDTFKTNAAYLLVAETTGKIAVVKPGLPQLPNYYTAAEALVNAILGGKVNDTTVQQLLDDFRAAANVAAEESVPQDTTPEETTPADTTETTTEATTEVTTEATTEATE